MQTFTNAQRWQNTNQIDKNLFSSIANLLQVSENYPWFWWEDRHVSTHSATLSVANVSCAESMDLSLDLVWNGLIAAAQEWLEDICLQQYSEFECFMSSDSKIQNFSIHFVRKM